jgi:regulator of sigma E protease
VTGIFDMLRKPATIKDSVGGTISIAVVTHDRVQQGLAAVFELAALLSISVGILNLLPIVPLDGGQMAMCFAELFRGGKRLSMRVQNVASLCGMAFIGMLIISVCFLDINRLFTANQPAKPPAAKKANP